MKTGPDQLGGRQVSKLNETTSTSAQWFDNDPGSRLDKDIVTFFERCCDIRGEELLPHLQAIVGNPI